MTIKKAKRRLFDFDFSKEGAAVHLVGPAQGNAANSYEILCTKSTDTLPDVNKEDLVEVSKALEQVSVNLSMEEFLRKFFHMWSEDAELLTKLLGFETEYEYWKEQNQGEEFDYSKYLEDKVSQFTIMKSMNDGSLETITKSALIDTLAMQEKFEKALESYTTQQKEKEMTELDIAKAAQLKAEQDLAANLDVIKSLETTVTALQEEIKVFKQAQVDKELEVIRNEVKELVAEDKLESVVKSLHVMDKEASAVVIETMKSAKKAAKEAIDNSDLMDEVGQGQETDVKKAKEAAAVAFLAEQSNL